MKPFERFPKELKGRIGYVLTDIDDTLTVAGQAAGRRLWRHGTAAGCRNPGGADHRPAGRLVRPHRPHVAGGCRRGGKRRVLFPV